MGVSYQESCKADRCFSKCPINTSAVNYRNGECDLPDRIDKAKVMGFLNDKWKGEKVCPICKSNAWVVAETLAAVQEFDRDKPFYASGPVWPLIQITCNVCGYTFYLNAILTGFLPPATSTESHIPASPESKTG